MEKSRFIFGRNVLFILALAFVIDGCAAHPCREPRAPELDLTKKTSVAPNASVPANSAAEDLKKAAASATSSSPATVTRIHVYKPDGSRQCEKQKKGTTLEVMERELAGIAVYGREKRPDGLMHIQVCGSPSGIINLYEIDSTFMKQAEQRGFKRFED